MQTGSRSDATAPSWLPTSTPETWDELARSDGPDHAIADCGSTESHERRLHAVLRLPFRPGETLLELGCGTGRLADLVPDGVTYEGLDWSAEMVELAQKRRPHIAFRQGTQDDLTPADWVVASGPFNYDDGWSKDRTAESFAAMWRASRRGIAVTVLRVEAERRLHYSPEELLSFVAELDWGQVELDRSYLPNDLCVRLWRGS
jgi:SAM-dependent methyltransferase